MKDFLTINLKELNLPAFEAASQLEIELERARLTGINAVKVIHGYGSHGVGGAIYITVRTLAKRLEKENKIKYFLIGNDWNLQNEKTLEIIYCCQDCYNDEDLNHSNPGITVFRL